MASKTLRGQGIGSKSKQDGSGVELAARQTVGFDCPAGHHFELVFAEEAELPTEWDCSKCGGVAVRSDGVTAEPADTKPKRTHWDMLKERRTDEELEEIFAERLEKLRAESTEL